MKLYKTAVSGTMESCDIMITLEPKDEGGIVIDLSSPVKKQFGNQIIKIITNTVKDMGIQNAHIIAIDKGAIDCTIKARTLTVIHRANQN